MPTYEYACKACGEHLEVVQSFKDAPLTTCPHCEGPLRKVFSPIGISFKGSGFYKTDSRAAASTGAKAGGDKADGGEKGAKKESASSEAKPASGDKKSEPKSA